ncbi:recombination regulator RecX, partial [Brochothrix thermosphacta DSM 20171 = FSL F6-1036]
MKKITKIEVQKKNEQRFNIYIDEAFACGVD